RDRGWERFAAERTSCEQTDSVCPRSLRACRAAVRACRLRLCRRSDQSKQADWLWFGPVMLCHSVAPPRAARSQRPEAALQKCDFSCSLPPNGEHRGSTPRPGGVYEICFASLRRSSISPPLALTLRKQNLGQPAPEIQSAHFPYNRSDAKFHKKLSCCEQRHYTPMQSWFCGFWQSKFGSC